MNSKRRIKDMATGEIGYTVPWAIRHVRFDGIWIRSDYPVKEIMDGTVMLKIKRQTSDVLVQRHPPLLSNVDGGYQYQADSWFEKNIKEHLKPQSKWEVFDIKVEMVDTIP